MRTALILSAVLAAIGTASVAAEPAARPDETALRYYAGQHQKDRVEAEASRLRNRFPGWQPPADLWSAQSGGEDEDGFWDLFAAGRDAELRAALAARSKAEPGWKASAPLAAAIALRELREACLPLMKANRWQDLATLAARRRAEVEAGDPEIVWAAAEAFGRTERQPEAYALLGSALSSGRFGPDERRVSLLRAMRFLPMADIDRLSALGAGRQDLDPIRVDLARGRISAVLHDEIGQSVAAAERAAFERYAETAPDPDQPALVAWLAFKQRDLPTALTWFKRAMTRGGDAMVAHGLAHTLRLMGLRRDAEEVAYAWREPLVNNTLLFIDLLETDLTGEIPPAIEPERLKRYAEVTLVSASGEGAQALAWYAYNNCQFDTALSWFRRAVAWFPKEATVYGYALAQRRMHQERAFLDTVNRYDGLFPKVVDLLFQPANDHPMPCESTPRRIAEPVAAPASGYLDLAPAAAPAGASRRGRVPQPDEIASGRAASAPTIRRSDFPIPVTMENDARAAPAGSAIPEPRWAERRRGPVATIARRVPGVGPMPYERYGFSLLPAWNGTEGASAPSAAEAPAPIGTLWSDERTGAPSEAAREAFKPAVDPERSAPATTGSIDASQAVRNQIVRKIIP